MVIHPLKLTFFNHTFISHGKKIVRRAFPLIACWAYTIHKVQGMTFQKIVIDIGSSVFEPGMAYVALSRVTTQQGLFITNFDIRSIEANDETLKENERLTKFNQNNKSNSPPCYLLFRTWLLLTKWFGTV